MICVYHSFNYLVNCHQYILNLRATLHHVSEAFHYFEQLPRDINQLFSEKLITVPYSCLNEIKTLNNKLLHTLWKVC